MTSHKNECDALRESIPLYVKGLLPEARRTEIEEATGRCPELRAEIAYWRTIECAFQEIERTIPEPSPRLYQTIMERVQRPGLFSRFIPSPRVAFAFAVLQFLIIIMLGAYIVQQKAEYKTMSTPSVVSEYAVLINVVFRETATEAEIRELLLKTGGKIMDGPSRSGHYRIGYTSPEHAHAALGIFHNSRNVLLAEKTY